MPLVSARGEGVRTHSFHLSTIATKLPAALPNNLALKIAEGNVGLDQLAFFINEDEHWKSRNTQLMSQRAVVD